MLGVGALTYGLAAPMGNSRSATEKLFYAYTSKDPFVRPEFLTPHKTTVIILQVAESFSNTIKLSNRF